MEARARGCGARIPDAREGWLIASAGRASVAVMSTQAEQTLDTTGATGALWGALAKAQADVTSVGKDGTNTQRGYRYATTEAMIRGSRQHLADHGLGFISTWKAHEPPASVGDIGKQHVAARVEIHWALGHEAGVVKGIATMDAVASPARPNDKAIAAAVTYGLGFVLRGLLLLDRAEEDEHSPDRRPEPQQDPALERLHEATADLARRCRVTDDKAQGMVCEAAGVWPSGTPTQQEIAALGAAARRLLLEATSQGQADRPVAEPASAPEPTELEQAQAAFAQAGQAYREKREADYLDAECHSPGRDVCDAIRDRAVSLACEAAGVERWPGKAATLEQLRAATEALVAGRVEAPAKPEPATQDPREAWRAARKDYVDARAADYLREEGGEPDADVLAGFNADALSCSAKAVGLGKWPARPKASQWTDAAKAMTEAAKAVRS